ncbi:MAG TPA: LacI family DNA-binding transcriptional regulator [Propionibacteriaceae bacterium]|nr:LacI family DNA-binding transcriptional regulator [Propionibacteriaceae bacterium]
MSDTQVPTPAAGVRRATIYDVAERAGVSKSLVSLVLQGSSRVSPQRRAAVERAIDELQYRPSRAASALAGNRTRTIGVLLDDYRNLWFVELLTGIQHELADLGFHVAVENCTFTGQGARSPLDGFISLRVDGIVVATEPTPVMAETLGIPVVVAGNRDLQLPRADVVTNDDRLGGRLATRHLLDLGHRMIGHLSGGGGAARDRREGYVDAMRGLDLELEISYGSGGTTEVDGYHAAGRLLDGNPGLTAIFAANDTMAFGALAAARDSGRRVPDDLSVVGYDDSPLASTHLLRLTTIDGKSREVGVEAAKALLSRMEEPTLNPRKTLVAPELVLRSSTCQVSP